MVVESGDVWVDDFEHEELGDAYKVKDPDEGRLIVSDTFLSTTLFKNPALFVLVGVTAVAAWWVLNGKTYKNALEPVEVVTQTVKPPSTIKLPPKIEIKPALNVKNIDPISKVA